MESLNLMEAPLLLIRELLRSTLVQKQVNLALKEFEGSGYIPRFSRNVARNALALLVRLESCPPQFRQEQITVLLERPTSKQQHISAEERAEIRDILMCCLSSLETLLEKCNSRLPDKPPLDPPLLSEVKDTFALREEYKVALRDIGAITVVRTNNPTKPFKFSTEVSLDSVLAHLEQLHLSSVAPFLEHVKVRNEDSGRSAEQALVAGSDLSLSDCEFPPALLSPKVQALVQRTPRGTIGMFVDVERNGEGQKDQRTESYALTCAHVMFHLRDATPENLKVCNDHSFIAEYTEQRDYCFVPIRSRIRLHNLVQWLTPACRTAKELYAMVESAFSRELPGPGSDDEAANIIMYGGTSGLLYGQFVGSYQDVKSARDCVAVQFGLYHPQSGDSGAVYLFQSKAHEGLFVPIAIHRVYDKELFIAGGTSMLDCLDGFRTRQEDPSIQFFITPNRLDDL